MPILQPLLSCCLVFFFYPLFFHYSIQAGAFSAMKILYLVVFLVIVAAEIPRIKSEFVSDDECEGSDCYEKPAKGFSIKDLIFWFLRFHSHDNSSDWEYSVDFSDWENQSLESDEEVCSSDCDL